MQEGQRKLVFVGNLSMYNTAMDVVAFTSGYVAATVIVHADGTIEACEYSANDLNDADAVNILLANEADTKKHKAQITKTLQSVTASKVFLMAGTATKEKEKQKMLSVLGIDGVTVAKKTPTNKTGLVQLYFPDFKPAQQSSPVRTATPTKKTPLAQIDERISAIQTYKKAVVERINGAVSSARTDRVMVPLDQIEREVAEVTRQVETLNGEIKKGEGIFSGFKGDSEILGEEIKKLEDILREVNLAHYLAEEAEIIRRIVVAKGDKNEISQLLDSAITHAKKLDEGQLADCLGQIAAKIQALNEDIKILKEKLSAGGGLPGQIDHKLERERELCEELQAILHEATSMEYVAGHIVPKVFEAKNCFEDLRAGLEVVRNFEGDYRQQRNVAIQLADSKAEERDVQREIDKQRREVAEKANQATQGLAIVVRDIVEQFKRVEIFFEAQVVFEQSLVEKPELDRDTQGKMETLLEQRAEIIEEIEVTRTAAEKYVEVYEQKISEPLFFFVQPETSKDFMLNAREVALKEIVLESDIEQARVIGVVFNSNHEQAFKAFWEATAPTIKALQHRNPDLRVLFLSSATYQPVLGFEQLGRSLESDVETLQGQVVDDSNIANPVICETVQAFRQAAKDPIVGREAFVAKQPEYVSFPDVQPEAAPQSFAAAAAPLFSPRDDMEPVDMHPAPPVQEHEVSEDWVREVEAGSGPLPAMQVVLSDGRREPAPEEPRPHHDRVRPPQVEYRSEFFFHSRQIREKRLSDYLVETPQPNIKYDWLSLNEATLKKKGRTSAEIISHQKIELLAVGLVKKAEQLLNYVSKNRDKKRRYAVVEDLLKLLDKKETSFFGKVKTKRKTTICTAYAKDKEKINEYLQKPAEETWGHVRKYYTWKKNRKKGAKQYLRGQDAEQNLIYDVAKKFFDWLENPANKDSSPSVEDIRHIYESCGLQWEGLEQGMNDIKNVVGRHYPREGLDAVNFQRAEWAPKPR